MKTLLLILLLMASYGCEKDGNFETVSYCYTVNEVTPWGCGNDVGDEIINTDAGDGRLVFCADSTGWKVGDLYCFTTTIRID